ncbi:MULTISPECIES: hypothetical protein [unclassified Brucella]|uniref:hypothetical protein n=1 Tax=unclassified Brucella TaxID=2632610 RepID=UPI000AC91B1E|nr:MULTISPECIES: hypothetical protein [unclassified Brucella]
MTKPTPKLEVKIKLDFPVPVKGEDGKEASRDTVTMRRPRTIHVKRLAVLLGADVLKGIIGEQEPSAVKIDKDNVDVAKLAVDVISALFVRETLDELRGRRAACARFMPPRRKRRKRRKPKARGWRERPDKVR